MWKIRKYSLLSGLLQIILQNKQKYRIRQKPWEIFYSSSFNPRWRVYSVDHSCASFRVWMGKQSQQKWCMWFADRKRNGRKCLFWGETWAIQSSFSLSDATLSLCQYKVNFNLTNALFSPLPFQNGSSNTPILISACYFQELLLTQ